MEVITVCDRRLGHLGKLVILFADGAYVIIGVYRSNASGVWQIFSGRQHDSLLNNNKRFRVQIEKLCYFKDLQVKKSHKIV